MAEWLKAHAWKVCLGLKPNEGSNPSSSAILIFHHIFVLKRTESARNSLLFRCFFSLTHYFKRISLVCMPQLCIK